jgi:two-component system KDP operon response regulator KdpE
MKKRILIIDDEIQIRKFMRISITAEGFEYHEADSGKKGLEALHDHTPHLIILDLGLPDIDGFHLLRKIREVSRIPVLILTARDEENEKVKLLEGGANDYLSKPFGVRELMARIKVLLRDLSSEEEVTVLRFEDLEINLQTHTVFFQGNEVNLSRKEFALLYALAENPGNLITQQTLLNDIWGASHVEDTHYLRVFISQLRKKFNDDSDSPKYIKTEQGVGYRFIAPPLGTQKM